MTGTVKTAAVWVWPPGELDAVLAGSFSWRDPDGPGEFSYADDYLARFPDLPLDPIAIPARKGPHKATRQRGIFGVLRDSGPDSWGTQLLLRQLGKSEIDPFDLLALGGSGGSGNIVVGDLTPERSTTHWSPARLEKTALSWALEKERKGPEFDDFLLVAAPTPTLGGTKPKLEIEVDDALWIVKFPDRGDPKDLAAIEATALSLAERCGIETPPHRVLTLGKGARTLQGLMIRRFDRTRIDGGYARLGFASAFTVMGLDTGTEAAELCSYFRFAHETRRWVARAGNKEFADQQTREIWRRVAFNGFVNNKDDHPRNHALIREGNQWRLSPLFDVIPFAHDTARRGLIMPFHRKVPDGNLMTVERLVASARLYGWTEEAARQELARMAAIVAGGWKPLLKQHGATTETIDRRASAFSLAAEIVTAAATRPP